MNFVIDNIYRSVYIIHAMTNTENKNKILEIALKLFSTKGYDAVGVQTLCEKAGITKPTLYYYFKNKEGVLDELLKVNYQKLNTLLEKNSHYIPHPKIYERDVIVTLTDVAQTYINFAQKNRDFYKIVLNATFAPDCGTLSKIAVDYNTVQYQILEKMFKSMARIHGNMKGAEKRLAWTFIGLVNTCIALKRQDSVQDFIKQFMHGIFS